MNSPLGFELYDAQGTSYPDATYRVLREPMIVGRPGKFPCAPGRGHNVMRHQVVSWLRGGEYVYVCTNERYDDSKVWWRLLYVRKATAQEGAA